MLFKRQQSHIYMIISLVSTRCAWTVSWNEKYSKGQLYKGQSCGYQKLIRSQQPMCNNPTARCTNMEDNGAEQ